jgi:hypothetical protein
MLAARRISVDYRSRLFWQIVDSKPTENAHFINTPYHVDPIIPHELYPPLLHLGPTGEIPAVVHFNDHTEKKLMDEWWGSFWWNRLRGDDQRFRGIVLDRLKNSMVGFAGDADRRKTWEEICPSQVLEL